MPSLFFAKDGKTYYGKDTKLFFDFTLKVMGTMKLAEEKSAGHWLCSCATPDDSEENSVRCVSWQNCFIRQARRARITW